MRVLASRFLLTVLIMFLMALAYGVPPASAQSVPHPPRPFICQPGQPGCPLHVPSVTISPTTETVTSRHLAVTVTMCDSSAIAADSVVLNGTSVTSTLTTTNTTGVGQCTATRTVTGTLTLNPGTNTFTAYVYSNFNGNFESAVLTETYTLPRGITVTPKGGAAVPLVAGPNDSVTFTVTNTETISDSATFVCASTAAQSCSVAAGKRIAAGVAAPVVVHLNAPGGATGTATLIGTMVGTGGADTGTINLQIIDRARVLRIVAAGGTQQVFAGKPIVVPFTVINSGNAQDTVNLTTTCVGSALSGSCTQTLATAVLAAGASKVDTVRVTAGATVGATGTVGLVGTFASASSIRDSAYTDITIRAGRSVGVELGAVNDFSQQAPNLCYTRAIAVRTAYECGNLRIAHPLPAIRTYNKLRVPTLLYNSQLAHPHPVISAIITLDSTKGTPDSVIAVLQDGNGVTLGRGSWNGNTFAHGASRQVSIGYDATGVATSEYSWKVQAQVHYDTTVVTYVTNEFYALVSAQTSHLGHGWTIAGIESIHVFSCLCSMLWSSGDGSAEFYQSTGSVFAPSSGLLTHPDTIKTDHSAGVLRYIRYAPHGVQVIFDSTGHHIMTRDRLGHVTTITYTNGTDVSTITVPAPNATLTYQFVYDGTTHMLDSVIAPSVGEPTRATKLTTNGSGDVTAIRDPDLVWVSFGYRSGGDPDVITSVTDRRGTYTAFTYDAAREIATVTTDSTSSGFKLTTSFAGANSSTLTAALNPDSVSMLINGPRTDVGDTTRLWFNRLGQPVRIRDAFGYETDVTMGNTTFVGLATRLRHPNGQVSGAVYDSRGNLASLTDSSIVISGTYATTGYSYDGKFDFVTMIDPPLHDFTAFTYDTTNGNRLTTKNALGDSTTIVYNYGNADSLLSSTQPPHTAKDSIEYDANLGNVTAQRTPLGYWTLTLRDGYGRDSLDITPIPAGDVSHDPVPATSVRDSVETTYDAMDRPTVTLTIAPTYNGVSRQKTTVSTTYDGEGAVQSVQTQASPDPNNIQAITTTYFYDRVGRLSKTVHPDATKDSSFYDAAGNADTVYTRRSNKIIQTFDALNRVTTRTVPSYTYPPMDLGIPADSGYPSFHMTMNPPYGNLTIAGDNATFGYDEVGNLVEADNADAKVSRVYDAGGRLVTETQRVRTRDGVNFGAHIYTVTNGYDLDSRRTRLVHPPQLAAIVGSQSGDTVLYGYDAASHLTTVREPLGGTFTYGYSARGDLASLTFPGGTVVERYGTDDDGRLTNDSIGPASGAANARKTLLGYDARGKIISGVNSFGIKDTVTTTYSAMGHVVAHNATYVIPPIDGNPQINGSDGESYTLDPLGNMVNSTDNTNYTVGSDPPEPTTGLTLAGYRLNVGQQTVRQGGHGSADSLLYDAEGNLIMTYQTFLVNGDAAVDLASYYGADNRLRMADHRIVANPLVRNLYITSRVVETYRYDALGRRVLKQADLWCPSTTDPVAIFCNRSTLRRIVWDGSQELDEIQNQDTSVVSIAEADTGVVHLDSTCNGICYDNNKFFGRVLYTNGLAADQPLGVTRVDYAEVTQTVGGVPGTPVPYHVHPPATFIPVWNAYGRWDQVIDYNCTTYMTQSRCIDAEVQIGLSPYDKLRVNVLSFMGSLLEDEKDETGTRYRRARTYNPTTGRFTQEDPLGLAGGLNAYGFANGDPVNYSDPFGLCPPQFRGNCTQADVTPSASGSATAVAGAALVGSIRNPIPATFARAVPINSNLPTLAPPGTADAFVTDAAAVRGLSAPEISARLGIRLPPGGYKVIEFPSSSVSNVASPINRTDPGFVGGGRTSGGAPEYTIPNGPIPEGAVTTEVPIGEIPIEIPITPVP